METGRNAERLNDKIGAWKRRARRATSNKKEERVLEDANCLLVGFEDLHKFPISPSGKQ